MWFCPRFFLLTDTATFAYKVDNDYLPESDRGLAFDDEQLNIDWKLAKDQLLMSDKNTQQVKFVELTDRCDYSKNYYA